MNLEALTSSHLFSKTHQSTLDLNRNDHDEHYGLSANSLIGSQIFQKLSEKFHSATNNNFHNNTNITNSNPMNMIRNQIVLNSSNFDTEEIRKQMEYDKFMNEIWIGIVLTLIVISMVFCICSCFLYHQFRQWKRNYRQNMHQNQNDIESAKLNPEEDDPVPEYTLVSGLPSYEAALELLHKSPNSCLIVYPSIFNVFNTNEKESQSIILPIQQQLSTTTTTTTTATNPATTMPSLQSQPSASQFIQNNTAPTAIAIKSLTSCSSNSSSSSSSSCSNNHSQHSIPSYDEATAYSTTKSSHIINAENCENALLETCTNFS